MALQRTAFYRIREKENQKGKTPAREHEYVKDECEQKRKEISKEKKQQRTRKQEGEQGKRRKVAEPQN